MAGVGLGVLVFLATLVGTLASGWMDTVHAAVLASGLAVAAMVAGRIYDGQRLSWLVPTATVSVLIAAAAALDGLGLFAGSYVQEYPSEARQSQDVSGPGPAEPQVDTPASTASEDAGPTADASSAGMDSTQEAPSPGASTDGTYAEPPRFDLNIDPRVVANGSPTISGRVSYVGDLVQELTASLGNLGIGTSIEFDLLDPYGGTVLGFGGTSQATDQVLTFDLHPPYSGAYTLTIVNRDTGLSASSVVNLDADSRGDIVMSHGGFTNPSVRVIQTFGRACEGDGVVVTLRTEGFADVASLHVAFPDGQYLDTTAGGDSAGAGYTAFGLRASSCTGTLSDIVATVTDSSGSAILEQSLSVPN